MERGSAAEHRGEKVVMGNKESEKEGQMGKKEKGRRKDKKEKKDKLHDGNADRSIHSGNRKHSVEMEQAESLTLAEMGEKPCSEHAKGGMSKSDVKKDRKRKKKDKEAETSGNKQILDTTDENVVTEHGERNKAEGEHDSMSKKGKRKRQDGEDALDGSAGDQIISIKVKERRRKKKRSATLEEGKQIDMPTMGEKREDMKKKRKCSDNVDLNLKQNTPDGGFGKNNKTEKKKSKDENGGGKRETEKGTKSKNKGR